LNLDQPSLAIALDDACGQIYLAWREGRSPTAIVLGAALFETVRAARLRELAAGSPLLILDLRVKEDDDLVGNAVYVI
jgi:hypothetical protein